MNAPQADARLNQTLAAVAVAVAAAAAALVLVAVVTSPSQLRGDHLPMDASSQTRECCR